MGLVRYPNYLKNNLDFSLKYKGFNALVEYVNTAAYNLQGSALNNNASVLLDTTQISEFLVLGNAYNVQLGYVFKYDFSLDLRYGQSFKEFSFNGNSILRNYDSMGVGFTKYFSNRAVKTQLLARYINFVTRWIIKHRMFIANKILILISLSKLFFQQFFVQFQLL